MKTVHIDEAEVVKNPHGVRSQKLYTSENASIMHLVLEPGEEPAVDVLPLGKRDQLRLWIEPVKPGVVAEERVGVPQRDDHLPARFVGWS